MSTSHSFLLPIFYRTVKGTAGSVAATFLHRIKLLSIICQLHANADQGAVLGIHQLRIGGGAEIAGVLVAGAQQVASRQAVVEGGLVDG